jgi:DNA-binding response OmpR family regulator
MLVWLIEDNPGDVFLFTQAMEQQSNIPVHIEVINDGESAVQALDGDQVDPDLILLDLNLPKLDGFEVLEKLREHKKQVPVLVLTSSESLRDMRAAYKLGASAYVMKPNNIDGVLRIVKSICALWLEPIRLANARTR